jgi:hypothetical protein
MPERYRTLLDDPAHWEALARRIEQAASAREGAVYWIARRASGLSLVALAAAVALAIGAGALRAPVAQAGPVVEWAAVVAPSDSVGRWVSGTSAPPLGDLILAAPVQPVTGR